MEARKEGVGTVLRARIEFADLDRAVARRTREGIPPRNGGIGLFFGQGEAPEAVEDENVAAQTAAAVLIRELKVAVSPPFGADLNEDGRLIGAVAVWIVIADHEIKAHGLTEKLRIEGVDPGLARELEDALKRNRLLRAVVSGRGDRIRRAVVAVERKGGLLVDESIGVFGIVVTAVKVEGVLIGFAVVEEHLVADGLTLQRRFADGDLKERGLGVISARERLAAAVKGDGVAVEENDVVAAEQVGKADVPNRIETDIVGDVRDLLARLVGDVALGSIRPLGRLKSAPSARVTEPS